MINVPNLKYKTTLCHNWKEGTLCEKVPNCYFAHGQDQLRTIEQNQQIIASRNMYYLQAPQSTNYKTVYCKFYAKGQCKLGSSCTFAHQKKQKRKVHQQPIYQQPPLMSYIQYSLPYIYPIYPNLDLSYYYPQNIQSWEKVDQSLEGFSPILKQPESPEIQSKSEEKKRLRIEEDSTNEKSKEDIQNQEEMSKIQTQKQCFNFQ